MNGGPPIVRVEQVHKRYGDGPPVLDGINLSVDRSEFISFIGPSGCGKSTLLRLIAGLIAPTTGNIVVDGMTPANAREEIFFVFQDPNLLPWRRVKANVELPLMLRQESTERRQQQVRAMIELVGLTEAADRFPWQLSGGMKMRVSIARALSLAPRILMLDEPFGALDEMTRNQLNEDLLAFHRHNPFTAFFVTHSVTEAVFLSTRVVVLAPNPGRVADILPISFRASRSAQLRETPEFLQRVAEVTRVLRTACS
jgi:NitT/TauT family transport system ATP-binding protein